MAKVREGMSSKSRGLRIVWVLASKDIVEAIRNKTTLTVLLGLSLMMLTVQALPILLKLDGRTRLAVADVDRTELAREMSDEAGLRVREVRNEGDAIAIARQGSGNQLSVVMPAGWSAGEGPLQIDGYHAHYLGADTVSEMVAASEAALSRATGRSVSIAVHEMYPTTKDRGREMMVALGMVLAIIMVTAILVPYLILDEKRGHTLEVLYVSPASAGQVAAGKALAGMVYGGAAGAVLLAFNLSYVVHWGLTLVTVVSGALLGVGLGLLVGLLVDSEGAVQLWVGGLSMVLMFPLILALGGANVSAWVDTSVNLLPTRAMLDLLRAGLGTTFPDGASARNLIILLGSALALHAVVVWRLHRWEAA